MKVLSKHKTAMERQITKLVRIETEKVDILLNSKDEWNGSKILRVVLEIGDRVTNEQWGGDNNNGNGNNRYDDMNKLADIVLSMWDLKNGRNTMRIL